MKTEVRHERAGSGDRSSPVRGFRTIPDILTHGAAHYPGRIALEQDGSELSYGELHREVMALRDTLLRIGVKRQSRVAIVLPNGTGLAVALLAATCSAVAVPLNPEYREPEYVTYFDTIGVTHLIVGAGMANPAANVARERGIPILELTDRRAMVAAPPATLPETIPDEPFPSGADIALILLTSGSTGRPKKVPLSHTNICVSVGDICETMALTPDDVCLCMWEQVHVGGLVDLLLVPLASGGRVICTAGFNVAKFFELLPTRRPTWFQGVPTTLYALVTQARARGVPEGSRLRVIRSVASALHPSLMQDVEARFGVPVVQTFGMTEAAPLITTNRLPPDIRKPGSVGRSCGPEIRIDAPDGTQLDAGAIGEVLIRGPNVFAGYEDAPEANKASFRDGWFRTGDLGYLDSDGYLFLSGRLKEMINRGGEKITPQEVDDVLLEHPAIAQAATFSVRHRTLGENVAAAIVLRPGMSLSEAEIRDHAAARLASFKVPQRIMLLDRMPVDPVGKINRLVLAIMAEGRGLSEKEIERLQASLPAAPANGPRATIAFHRDASGPPVFFALHAPEPQGRALADTLASIPLYALSDGTVGGEALPAEKVGAFYAREIMEYFAADAVYIGGGGSGAPVASAIASELAGHGRPAAGLVLLDPVAVPERFGAPAMLLFSDDAAARAAKDNLTGKAIVSAVDIKVLGGDDRSAGFAAAVMAFLDRARDNTNARTAPASPGPTPTSIAP
jgi:acyl-CoA synthetase (AMP-forming)/AMP-acid ligase II